MIKPLVILTAMALFPSNALGAYWGQPCYYNKPNHDNNNGEDNHETR